MRRLGAVLAGGVGRRFGGDKALALLDGAPLIAHVAAALAAECDAVVVCGRALPGVATLADRPGPGLGPLGGIAAALRHAADAGFAEVLTTPCDTPRLPAGLAGRLGPAPAFAGGLPLIGVWPSALADHLDAWLGEPANGRSVRAWALAAGARAIEGLVVANVNTPADLAALGPSP